MRLLHLNHRYAPFPGGSERFIQEVSEHRARLGDDVTVVTTDAFDLEYFWDRQARRLDAAATEDLNGVHVHRVPVRPLPGSAWAFPVSRRMVGELARFVRWNRLLAWPAALVPRVPGLRDAMRSAGPVDLVHATNLGLEGLALSARAYAAETGAPFVLTPFIHLGDDEDSVAHRFVSMPHQRELMLAADAVVAMTDCEARFVEALGVERDRIIVTGAGVDIDEVTGGDEGRFRARLGLQGRVVGTLGALATEKGTLDTIAAAARVRARGIDLNLVLAGPELSGFSRWFDGLPAELRQGVYRLGVIDQEAKRDMLAALDILVLPSRTESFGIVYLEAWANRKPVIAARAGAVEEVVRDGETGITVPFGDVAAIEAALLRLLSDPVLAATMGNAGFERVDRSFRWPAVMARVDQAYRRAQCR